MPAYLQFWIALNHLQGMRGSGLPHHQTRRRQNPLTMSLLDGQVGLFIQTQIVSGKYNGFVHDVALAESNYTWLHQIGKETAMQVPANKSTVESSETSSARTNGRRVLCQ